MYRENAIETEVNLEQDIIFYTSLLSSVKLDLLERFKGQQTEETDFILKRCDYLLDEDALTIALLYFKKDFQNAIDKYTNLAIRVVNPIGQEFSKERVLSGELYSLIDCDIALLSDRIPMSTFELYERFGATSFEELRKMYDNFEFLALVVSNSYTGEKYYFLPKWQFDLDNKFKLGVKSVSQAYTDRRASLHNLKTNHHLIILFFEVPCMYNINQKNISLLNSTTGIEELINNLPNYDPKEMGHVA
jgi:hypothetical protein